MTYRETSMDQLNCALREECFRLVDTCLYTSTSLFIWLRFCRFTKTFFLVVPLLLGSLSTWNVLTQTETPHTKSFTAICAFLAGVLPAVYAVLKMDRHLDQCCRLAGEFKNLQDRFRQAAEISSLKDFAIFEAEVQPFFKRLEKARSESFTAPEWCFRLAQKKVNRGDYTYTVDDPKASPMHPVALQYLAASQVVTEESSSESDQNK